MAAKLDLRLRGAPALRLVDITLSQNTRNYSGKVSARGVEQRCREMWVSRGPQDPSHERHSSLSCH